MTKPNENTEEEEKITIRRFDLTTLMTDAIIVLIGKRRSGKSFLTREIIYYMAKKGIPYGKIFSHTEHCNPFYRKFFPPLFIDDELSEDKLSAILNSQHKKIKRRAKMYNLEHGKHKENNMLLLFDDMMSDDDIWKKSKSFKKIFIEGRHSNLLFCLSLQYVLGIPPALRSNVDYAFLFASDGASDLKKLYENYASVIPTFHMFKQIFYQCTRNFGCLVINRTTTSDDLRDKVFYYKADARGPPPFRFGSKGFWKMNDDAYQSSDDEDEDMIRKKKVKKIIETYGVNGKKYAISFGE